MPTPPPYRDFYYPLNVFMHILTQEQGFVRWLHYGLFEREDESIDTAQERSTEMLLARLPPPPARLLEVGIGLGTTLHRLVSMGYEAEGITPDEKQIAVARDQYGADFPVRAASFETFDGGGPYDTIIFQESSQYIDSDALFARAEDLTVRVVVLDEFALREISAPGALRSLDTFLDAASRHGFSVTEQVDVSHMAPPTIRYFMERIPKHRRQLAADLGLTDQQIDDLIASGREYLERYEQGIYGYRLMALDGVRPVAQTHSRGT